MNNRNDWPVGINGLVGIVSCVIGLGVIYLGYGIGTDTPKKDSIVEAAAPAQPKRRRPVRAMNLALGPMVYFAQDLGFRVENSKGDAVDATKIAARIENQLLGIRELYRRAVAENPALAGSVTLGFQVGPSGEVSQVRELSARVRSSEFKTAVAAALLKWSFAEIVGENLHVTCPLLFVHEGMDITTLVQWEKSLDEPADKNAVARRLDKAPPTAAPAAAKSISTPSAMPTGKVFRIKYATSLRREPNFSAASLTALTIGTKVTALGQQGDWLKVRFNDNGSLGFIRKEFVTPVDLTRK